MRFTRASRVRPYEPNARKRAAGAKRLRLDREKLPLLAPLVAEEQPTLDELMDARAQSFVNGQRSRRAFLAKTWREARSRLAALPEPERSALRAYWNNHRWLPGDPTYLASTIHSFEKGDLILHEGQIINRKQRDWEVERKATITAMTDGELDAMIQTHISPLFVEWGREERRRRAEASALEAPAPRPRRRRR